MFAVSEENLNQPPPIYPFGAYLRPSPRSPQRFPPGSPPLARNIGGSNYSNNDLPIPLPIAPYPILLPIAPHFLLSRSAEKSRASGSRCGEFRDKGMGNGRYDTRKRAPLYRRLPTFGGFAIQPQRGKGGSEAEDPAWSPPKIAATSTLSRHALFLPAILDEAIGPRREEKVGGGPSSRSEVRGEVGEVRRFGRNDADRAPSSRLAPRDGVTGPTSSPGWPPRDLPRSLLRHYARDPRGTSERVWPTRRRQGALARASRLSRAASPRVGCAGRIGGSLGHRSRAALSAEIRPSQERQRRSASRRARVCAAEL
ncbi:hypothetical protein KM043_010524 [Ampulex compressa]|nr:hypothetical protein KM043_010524 [Ampulex compressa]